VPDDLATAAVFGDLTQAQAARLHLEAAGIPAFLADETIAGSIFVWSPAVGGIKLQVPASRLDEALRALDERMAEGGATDWSEVDVGVPEAGDPDDESAAPDSVPTHPEVGGPSPEAGDGLTLRERRADGLFRAILMAMLFAPLILFAFWRLVQIWVSDDRLGPNYRRKAQFAGAFIVPYTVGVLFLWRFVCCGMLR
jgi:hypothetical protein